MIRTGTKLQLLAFLLVSVLGVTYVAVRYVGIGGRGYIVHADFADAGGIFANAPVTYRGSPVGRVTGVRLHAGGVRADLRLDQGVRVPSDLRAVVAQRSAVGEQYLDLRPNQDGGPYLSDGSVIPSDRTGTPIAAETLLSNLDTLVRSVDPDDLGVVIDELGIAFEGNEAALRTIFDASDALLADAVANLPQTVALIRDGRTVLTTQAESAAAIRRWAKGLADLSATLKAADPDLRKLLTTAPPAATELVALLRDLEPTIGTLLGNLVTVNGIAARRLPGIEQILVVYPLAVAGGFTVTPGDGTAHLGLVVNIDDPPSCKYQGSTRCDSVRGTGNAPRPGGREPAQPDPETGVVTEDGGAPLWFGGTGGQYQMAGDQSWKQLLLSGLAP
ncbi:MCE family protein [Phytohabitans aurantiacus]|uniref:ABC transporter substrate-binding protein n=1 Tax=Phytohabitans aurantiacus TaxID=3016789 RepID=A0ABQ5R3V0_9ACTN|nr:MCE family protein [Phytohabitans aurantiacus]GLI01090.1 ABC transporter substrate-binding protein [Phytohabitans aurantiacus]